MSETLKNYQDKSDEELLDLIKKEEKQVAFWDTAQMAMKIRLNSLN
jgi:hypothetical protein